MFSWQFLQDKMADLLDNQWEPFLGVMTHSPFLRVNNKVKPDMLMTTQHPKKQDQETFEKSNY